MRLQPKGFTLIELLIVIVIVAILAAVAIPNYTEYVRKARRTEAQTAMLAVAAGLEKFLLANNSYPPKADIDLLINGDATRTGVSGIPLKSAGTYYTTQDGNYRITFNDTNARNIIAISAGIEPGGAQENDTECAVMMYYLDSVKYAADDQGAETTSTCWSD